MVEILEADVLVIGAGMAGMTAAHVAAQSGATVVVVEKAPHLGGSAAMSGGFVWTAANLDNMRTHCPEGDPALGETLVSTFPRFLEWLESTGVALEGEQPVMFGRGRRLDVLGHMRRGQRVVESKGGSLVLSCLVGSLLTSGGAIVGALVRDASGPVQINAPRTIIAAGGFQGNRGMLERYFGPSAARLLLRSNPYSTGDGLMLGLSVGADTTGHMDTFYGHLIAGPPPEFTRAQFVRFAAFLSEHGVLLNIAGERFADESLGDHRNAQAVAREQEGRALLVVDDAARSAIKGNAFVAGLEAFDVVEETCAADGRIAACATTTELAAAVGRWGYPAERVQSQLDAWASGAAAPFYALEVRPAITFTQGGLRVNTKSQVLRSDGAPVPGLYAAGADAGGAFNGGYAGGLALAGVFGMIAGADATS